MIDLLTPPFDPQKILENKRALKKQLLLQEGLLEKRVALLGGSTIGEIKSILELFLLSHGIKPIFFEGQYGLYYEELAFENPALAEFHPDVIYIHTTSRNIMEYPRPGMSAEEREALLQGTFSRWSEMWQSATTRYGCVVLQNNFDMLPYRIMGNMDAVHRNGRLRFLSDLNALIYDFQLKNPRFHVNDINYLSACYGLDQWHDAKNWYLFKYALTPGAIPVLCHSVAAIIKAVYGKNKKALALDLDNTLWGGVIGDEGAENIRLGMETPEGMAFLEFQQYIGAVSDTGVILGVCSKNEEENALSGLSHPTSALKREEFASFKANWEPKHLNLQAMAKELNIGLDSIVFADDNPAERQVVRGFLPQVETVPLSVPEEYIRALDRQAYFETVSLSEDDLNRNSAYRQNMCREASRALFKDYEDYLRSLKMICRVDRFHSGNLGRVTQLINKTNQFNLTTARLSEAEAALRAEDPSYIALCGALTDRFGDNGIVIVLGARVKGEEAEMELFLMSCRVFKRRLEDAMLDEMIRRLKQAGVKKLTGLYFPTGKNALVKDFYLEQGFTAVSKERFELDLRGDAAQKYDAMEIVRYDA